MEMVQKKPNIIVFMLDSLRPDYLGCYGSEIAKSPEEVLGEVKPVLFSKTSVEIILNNRKEHKSHENNKKTNKIGTNFLLHSI